jgi:hypothetical protein
VGRTQFECRTAGSRGRSGVWTQNDALALHKERRRIACRLPTQVSAWIQGPPSQVRSEREWARRQIGGRDRSGEERIDVAVFGSMWRFVSFALATTCTPNRDALRHSFATSSPLGIASTGQAGTWGARPDPSQAKVKTPQLEASHSCPPIRSVFSAISSTTRCSSCRISRQTKAK